MYEKYSDSKRNYALIDFKNTAPSIPKTSDIFLDDRGVLGDFQIPVYVNILEHCLLDGLKDGTIETAYFYSISDRTSTLVIDEFRGKAKNSEGPERPYGMEQFADTVLKTLDSYTSLFALDIKNSKTPQSREFNPHHKEVKTYKHCIKCKYNAICRTNFIIGARTLNSPAQLHKGTK